ncbi:unnamed protein product, partial [Amoebophrya sp. A120]
EVPGATRADKAHETEIDPLTISLQEFLAWEQTTLKTWADFRKFLIQFQGVDFSHLYAVNNEAR